MGVSNDLKMRSESDYLVINQVRSEVKENNYQGLHFLLDIILKQSHDEAFIRRSPELCIKVIKLMVQARQNKAIEIKILNKAMAHLFADSIFKKQNFDEEFFIACKYDELVSFNTTLLKWASEKFYNAADTEDFTKYCGKTLYFIKHFAQTNDLLDYSLLELCEPYELAAKYELQVLERLCENKILEKIKEINSIDNLLHFISKVREVSLSETSQSNFESQALLAYLNNNKICARKSAEGNFLCLSAAHFTMLDNPGPLKDLLNAYVSGFIIGNEMDLAAALLFCFMPENLQQSIKEISLFQVFHNDSCENLRNLFALFPNLTHLNAYPKLKDERNKILNFQAFVDWQIQSSTFLTLVDPSLKNPNPIIDLTDETTLAFLRNTPLLNFTFNLVVRTHSAQLPDLSVFKNYTIEKTRCPDHMHWSGNFFKLTQKEI